jgi:selenocysteine-specific translation elongation factor
LEFDECVELILALLGANPATIVIDAVDECDPAGRYKLLMALGEILQESANIAKVFVRSRDDRDIVDWLASSPNSYVSTRDNSKDC